MFVIVGATAGLGKEIAYKLAKDNHDLFIVSSDVNELRILASSLKLEFGIEVTYKKIDFSIQKLDFSNVINYINKNCKRFEGILFPIGYSNELDNADQTEEFSKKIINVNFTNIVCLINLICQNKKLNQFTITGFGSIASFRGRSKNIIYSASKAALETFFESLRHMCIKKNIKVQFYIVGYLKTNLSFGKSLLFKKESPKKFAEYIIRNIYKDVGVIYYPSYWYFVRITLFMIPWKFFKIINF